MNRFYVDSIPEHQTIFQYIKEKSDWYAVRDKCKPTRAYEPMLEFDLSFIDFDRLRACLSASFDKYGQYGWVTKDAESETYTGVSLMYNPNHQDGLLIHQSSLGTPKNPKGTFFWNSIENHEVLKNSYYDTYAFCKKTPFAEDGYLGELLNQFGPSMIRSRISTIHARFTDPNNLHKRWHKDESVFENIRLNIPVTTSPEFLFELEGYPPINLKVGTGYSWDTNVAHGVYSVENTLNTRTNIVLGFSPWFNFNTEGQYWEKNEFYGKHPFDMYHDGDICSLLQLK